MSSAHNNIPSIGLDYERSNFSIGFPHKIPRRASEEGKKGGNKAVSLERGREANDG